MTLSSVGGGPEGCLSLTLTPVVVEVHIELLAGSAHAGGRGWGLVVLGEGGGETEWIQSRQHYISCLHL